MAACAIVQVEPRPQTRIVTLDVLDLGESHEARLEKRLFIGAETIDRASSARGVTTDSRIQGKEIGMEADGRAEQQRERKKRKGYLQLSEHRIS
jgi:hypothetical protein